MLHTVHDGTAATVEGYQGLMRPGYELLRERRNLGEMQARYVRDVSSPHPHPDDLWDIADSDRPRVVLTLAHGEGAPRAGWPSAEAQRRDQGAVSFGSGRRIAASDVAQRVFLPGGVWFSLACFGAGTPVTSAYHAWVEELIQLGHVSRDMARVRHSLAMERPFIAALPKALLANPHGPLAFIGHLDLAWSYSFADIDDRPGHHRPGRFAEVVRSLLARDRVGVAFRSLSRFLGEVCTELTAVDENGAPASGRELARRAHLWMLRQDLAGYVVLGDPAVRLPLATDDPMDAAALAPRQTVPNTVDVLNLSDGPAIERQTAKGLPLPLAELEQAIGKVLSGCFDVESVARAHGLPSSELERWVERYRASGRVALTRT